MVTILPSFLVYSVIFHGLFLYTNVSPHNITKFYPGVWESGREVFHVGFDGGELTPEPNHWRRSFILFHLHYYIPKVRPIISVTQKEEDKNLTEETPSIDSTTLLWVRQIFLQVQRSLPPEDGCRYISSVDPLSKRSGSVWKSTNVGDGWKTDATFLPRPWSWWVHSIRI